MISAEDKENIQLHKRYKIELLKGIFFLPSLSSISGMLIIWSNIGEENSCINMMISEKVIVWSEGKIHRAPL